MAAFLYRMAGSPAWEPPEGAVFTDVGPGHAFFGPISWLASVGVAGGFGDGSFRPTAVVSRQAMAAFLYRMAGSPG